MKGSEIRMKLHVYSKFVQIKKYDSDIYSLLCCWERRWGRSITHPNVNTQYEKQKLLWLQSCVRVLHYFPIKVRPIMREQLSKAGLNSWPQNLRTADHSTCKQLPQVVWTADHSLCSQLTTDHWSGVNGGPEFMRTADHRLREQLITACFHSWPQFAWTADHCQCQQLIATGVTADHNFKNCPQLLRTAHSLCK